jgi:transcriptional regulator with XRE-family HTH domain
MSKEVDPALRQFYKEVGRRIQKIRRGRKMTQELLASRVSLTRTSITNIEAGDQKFLVHTLVDIARILQVPITSLLPEIYETTQDEISAALKDHPSSWKKWVMATVESNRKDGENGSTS